MRVIKNAFIRALKKPCYFLLTFILLFTSLPLNLQITQVQAQTLSKTTVKGVYDYLHQDFEDGTSSEVPYLYQKDTGTAIKLEGSGAQIPQNYVGDEISVTGNLNSNVLSFAQADNSSLYSLSAAGAAVSVSAATNVGSDSVAVFYVNFVDHRERTMTYDSINDYVFRNYKDFLARSSNGLFTITGNAYLLDLDINKTCEMYNLVGLDGDLVKYTKIKASQQGINVDSFDHKVVIIDKSLSCPHGGEAYRPAEFAYSVGLGAVAHELGHLYGLDHAGAYDCLGSFIENDCGFQDYWNYVDIMGGSNEYIDGDYGPYHKEQMGWLQGSQIAEASVNGTYTLERFEDLPGAPGPLYPTKVLKVRTFPSGPVYYISHRRKQTREGVTIELASGGLSGYKKTALLDTTPGTDAGINDFFDGYLHDGQAVTDPFNGIVFEQLSHDTNNATVRISFVQPTANFSFMDLNFNRATGYLSAVGRRQDVPWSAVNYVVSLKCTSNFFGCPADLGDKLTTTSTNGDIQMANGFSYEYSVDIYTKKDGDPNQVARYFWYKASKNNVSCPGGASTCNVNVDWPAVNYKASLVKAGTSTKVCNGASGCQDFIAVGAPTTDVSFRGLIAIDGNMDLESTVEIVDFGGGAHLLQRVKGLGKPDDYFNSCSSSSALVCTIGTPSGIGPFVGGEPILVSVKVGDQNGYIISGPANTRAGTDGSYTRNWISWNGEKAWDYHVVIYPDKLYQNCYEAGGECQVQSIYDTDGTNFNFRFAALRNNTDYRVIVCAMTCNPSSGNTKIIDTIKRSDMSSLGPSFFASDPFDQSIKYTAEYFDNFDLTNKKVVRSDTNVDFRWGTGSPDPLISPDTFSVRWKGNFIFDTAVYRFMTTADDGIRVYIDGSMTPVIDAWNGPILNQGAMQMTAGVHEIKVEYRENTGTATAKFSFNKAYECYDLSGDNLVNSGDQLIMAIHFNAKGITPWDLNGDKVVNSGDQARLASKFGKTCPYQ